MSSDSSDAPDRTDAERPLGVVESFTVVRDQCPSGAVRAVAESALDAVTTGGPHVLREQALRAAVNTTIQGTAADLMKMAMLGVDRRMKEEGGRARLLLQVHDELLLELPPEEGDAVRGLVREAMEGVYPLSVPLTVDLHEGESWAEAK